MRLRHALLTTAVLITSVAAHADSINFSISGADNFSGSQKVTGTTTVDTATGIVTAISFTTLPNDFIYSIIMGQSDQGDVSVLGTDGTAHFTFTDPLKAYNGGTFNLRVPNETIYNGHVTTISGTLTPVSSTPEPSSIILLGTGLCCYAFCLRNRGMIPN